MEGINANFCESFHAFANILNGQHHVKFTLIYMTNVQCVLDVLTNNVCHGH